MTPEAKYIYIYNVCVSTRYLVTQSEDALLLPAVDVSLQLAGGAERTAADRPEVAAQRALHTRGG